jgi:hypothetical protein
MSNGERRLSVLFAVATGALLGCLIILPVLQLPPILILLIMGVAFVPYLVLLVIGAFYYQPARPVSGPQPAKPFRFQRYPYHSPTKIVTTSTAPLGPVKNKEGH